MLTYPVQRHRLPEMAQPLSRCDWNAWLRCAAAAAQIVILGAGACSTVLDVHFVSPAPVPSPGNAGLQPGSRSHAGAWRSQGQPWRTGGVFMKQTSRRALGTSRSVTVPGGDGVTWLFLRRILHACLAWHPLSGKDSPVNENSPHGPSLPWNQYHALTRFSSDGFCIHCPGESGV